MTVRTVPAKPPGGRYVLLDGMRGIAAIAVMLYHVGWQLGLQLGVFPHGYLAVDFFFMLSGFVIADAYDRRLVSGLMSLGSFMLARIIRLYPMIVIGTLIGLAVKLALIAFGVDHESLSSLIITLVAGLLFEPFLLDLHGSPIFSYPLDPPMWSLFLELLANMAYAALARHLSWRKWLLFTAVFGVLLIWFSLSFNGLFRGSLELRGGLIRVGFSFFMGVVLWHLRDRYRLPTFRAGLLAACLTIVLEMPMLPHINMVYDLFAVLIFAALVLCASRIGVSKRYISLAEWLAGISYPLYLIHGPFLKPLFLFYQNMHLHWAEATVALVIVSGFLLGLSHLILHYFDEPVRAYLRKLASSRSLARAQTAP